MNYKIINGNNIEVLRQYPDNHFHSIVTDPPYGISFLGKDWDKDTGAMDTYKECLRVLKPGGHILAFSAARTYHHLAMTLEQVGFEIRDQIMWIYSSGFPKSQDVGKSIDRAAGKKDPNYGTTKLNMVFTEGERPRSCKVCNKIVTGGREQKCKETPCGLKYTPQTDEAKQWIGWGTNLKPAHEPIVMARKPTKLSIANNVQKHGTGALNIDATRIQGLTEKELSHYPQRQHAPDTTEIGSFGASGLIGQEISMYNDKGRFPSNVIGEVSGYEKYFYQPKVSRKERNMGCGDIEIKQIFTDGRQKKIENAFQRNNSISSNNHPTVKPVELMKYLIKLVTPPGGHVLDPFNGSGSTGMAAVELGYEYTGIDLDENYCQISTKRIEAWYKYKHPTTYQELFEENK